MSKAKPIFEAQGVINPILEEIARAEKKFSWWPTDPVYAAAIVAEEAGGLVRGWYDSYNISSIIKKPKVKRQR